MVSYQIVHSSGYTLAELHGFDAAVKIMELLIQDSPDSAPDLSVVSIDESGNVIESWSYHGATTHKLRLPK